MKRNSGTMRLAAVLLVAAGLAPFGSEAQSPLTATTRLETGRLLVARPGMADPNFAETVVLLLSYGEDGAMGVIVNRPTRLALAEVLPDVERLGESSEVVYRGGPVAVNRMIFALRTEDRPAGCEPVLADVCAGGSLELVEVSLDRGAEGGRLRGFVGYAGWASGQLEWEIEQYGWYVLPGSSGRVFDSAADELWSELVRVAESPVA